MRVLLYNHTGLVSGAERSLLELAGGLHDRGEELLVASPDGPLAAHLGRLGIAHARVPGTNASFKVGPAALARAGGEIARAAVTLRRIAARFGADVVHANSVRAGLIAGPACAAGPPAVVHVRDELHSGRMVDAVRFVLDRVAAHVVAISGHVERSLGLARAPVTVLHNPVDLRRFDPDRVRPAAFGAGPLLGVIAQITPWKGQDDAIRALASLREREPSARLLIVGEPKFVGREVRFDNRRFRAELTALAQRLGVTEAVEFLGEREDVPEILAALDLLLVPSWQEPFGRTVIEGMAMGRAVLATAVGGPAEVIEDGVDGRLLPPRRPEAWAQAAAELLADRAALERMEGAARAAAARFDRDRYAARVLELYAAVSRSTAAAAAPAAPTPPGPPS